MRRKTSDYNLARRRSEMAAGQTRSSDLLTKSAQQAAPIAVV